MMFSPIFRKDFIAIDSNGIILNFKKRLFSRDSHQWFFFEEGVKPDISKLEETRGVFRAMLNDLYQIIVNLNTLTHLLRKLLQKEVDFDWTGLKPVTKLLKN